MAYDKKRLDTLIRQGMMPAKSLPILHRALDKLKAGQTLTPYEREGISKLMDKVMGFQFGDDITYNRARLHTQKTRYQTEELTVAENKEGEIIVHDGSEDSEEAKKEKKVKKNAKSKNAPEDNNGEEVKEAVANRPSDKQEGDKESPKQGGSEKPEIGTMCEPQDSKPSIKEGLSSREEDEERFKRLSKKKKGFVSSKAVAKEKEKAGLAEDLMKFNTLYKQNLETALANNKVNNVRDIPESIKQDLFKHVEEATYSDKQIKMAKGIAFDKRHKGGDYSGAAKKAEKIKKGLSDHPAVSDALRRANEELELGLSEGKLKDFAMDHGYDFKNTPKNPDSWLAKKALKHGIGPKRKKGPSHVTASDINNANLKNKPVKEEAEQIDEISKGLAATYKKAAQKDRKNTEARLKRSEDNLADIGSKNSRSMAGDDQYHKDSARSDKRAAGIASANKRIKESKMASKDHDGDGKIESGKDEYFGSKDKAIKKALKKVPSLKKEETEVKKTPNQAVRDVHRTVADVLAGRTIEVSDEPLVVDPNVESQAELDRTVNVQEGAREDAMRDIARDKDLAKPKKPAPTPGKSKHDGSENKGPDHIVAQLRKAISLGDKHDGVKFQDGKTHKVKASHAHKLLNKYISGKPADKEKMQSHGHASHDNFKKHID